MVTFKVQLLFANDWDVLLFQSLIRPIIMMQKSTHYSCLSLDVLTEWYFSHYLSILDEDKTLIWPWKMNAFNHRTGNEIVKTSVLLGFFR